MLRESDKRSAPKDRASGLAKSEEKAKDAHKNERERLVVTGTKCGLLAVWAEYHPVTILVNKELDIHNKTQVHRFWQMVDEFEHLPLCKGQPS